MIGTIDVRISAAHPEMPLRAVAVFAGSAATIRVEAVPLMWFGTNLTSVAVAVQNADGAVAAVAAAKVGAAWCATFGANHFGTVGTVENGLTVTASGTDETGAARTWTLGRGDVEVLDASGVPVPGETLQFVRVRESVPESPAEGDMALVDGAWQLYHGGAWTALGGETVDAYTKSEVDDLLMKKQGVLPVDEMTGYYAVTVSKAYDAASAEYAIMAGKDTQNNEIHATYATKTALASLSAAVEEKQDVLPKIEGDVVGRFNINVSDALSSKHSDSADNANNDGDGRNIVDTYVTKIGGKHTVSNMTQMVELLEKMVEAMGGQLSAPTNGNDLLPVFDFATGVETEE